MLRNLISIRLVSIKVVLPVEVANMAYLTSEGKSGSQGRD